MTNLILVDCHDLGQHLGVYGRTSVSSPHLDDMAAGGVRFANSFCTAPQCSPSRAALYTGRYAHANGMLGLAHPPFNWRLNPGEMHLARYLKDAGYATILIGIQHVTAASEQATQALGFTEVWRHAKAADVAECAAACLENVPRQPFFLKIGFTEPHRDEQGLFRQAPPDTSLGVEIPPYLPQTSEAAQELAELQGVIHLLDEAIGRIWATLQELNLLEDTWVIFTTDHGLAMPRAKCTLYDPGIRTALIMVAPAFGLTGGRVYYDELISNVDLVPTILDMLEIRLPARLQGKTFSNLLRGTDYQPRSCIFAEKTFHTAYEPQRAIRTARYKLIWNGEVNIISVPADIMRSPIYPQMVDDIAVERPPFELYDLQADPLERVNLIDERDHSDIAEDLRRQLLDWMRSTGDPLLEGPVPSPFYDVGLRQLTQHES